MQNSHPPIHSAVLFVQYSTCMYFVLGIFFFFFLRASLLCAEWALSPTKPAVDDVDPI